MPDDGLVLRGVAAGYFGAPVVRKLDLTVAPGEIVALLGPNGAGKTTTLRAVSGLIPTLAGSIYFDGQPLKGRQAHRISRLGTLQVPESRGLFSQLTVAENLRLGRQRGLDVVGSAVAHFPELERLLNRRAGLLSGGEQQMLSVGRALALRPRVLLVDELSLGLAPVVVERLVTRDS